MIESALQKFALMGASWVLYLLLAMSIFSIGIICERALYFRSHSGDVEALGNELLRLLKVGDRRNAVALLQGSKSTEAAILLPAMDWLDGGAESVAEALESSLVKKRAELERGLTSLGTLGNNAPFVGLFGTVIGVIQAFHMLGASNAGANQGAMGNVIVAISDALIATGVGLIVALPAVVGYNLSQKKVSTIENNVSVISKQILALLKADPKLLEQFAALSEEVAEEEAAAEVVGEPELG
ncbi:MAG TPA: MotA/TolQ/ExbB proton channel family protein [Polyangiaceae bacterium]|nr:MotA/TolQ/ExbB proton channel family protein [Polyangiaceae bacterium]